MNVTCDYPGEGGSDRTVVVAIPLLLGRGSCSHCAFTRRRLATAIWPLTRGIEGRPGLGERHIKETAVRPMDTGGMRRVRKNTQGCMRMHGPAGHIRVGGMVREWRKGPLGARTVPQETEDR